VKTKAMIKLVVLTFLFIFFAGILLGQEDPEQRKFFTSEAREIIFDKKKSDSSRIKSISRLTHYFYDNGLYDSSIYYLDYGIELTNLKKEFLSNELQFLQNKVLTLLLQSKYYEAIDINKKLVAKFLKLNNQTDLYQSYLNMASVYFNLGDFDEAESCIEKVLLNLKFLDSQDQESAYGVKVQILKNTSNLEEALKLAYTARNLAINNKHYYATFDYELADIYKELGQLDSAKNYFQSSYDLSLNIKPSDRIIAAIELAKYRIQEGFFDLAINLLMEAKELSFKIGDYHYAIMALELLIEQKEHLNENSDLIVLYEQFKIAQDSAQSIKSAREFYVKEYKDKALQSENEIKEFRFRQEVKQREIESNLKQKQLILIFSFSLLILVLFFIYIAKLNKDRNKLNLLLNEIQLLKENLAEKSFVSDTVKSEKKVSLDRVKIQNKLDAKLNETDWNILCKLVENPSINNKELASQIALSYEGVRSSFKKMYSLFDLRKDSGKNIRMELVIQALRCSQND